MQAAAYAVMYGSMPPRGAAVSPQVLQMFAPAYDKYTHQQLWRCMWKGCGILSAGTIIIIMLPIKP
jgi:hypothetical protein